MSENNQGTDVIEWAVEIVSSYVSNNSVPASELPALLSNVHDSLRRISGVQKEAPAQPPSPAVSIRKSVADDHLVCLEDGKTFKSLKRHLQSVHSMTPDQYRERWNLGRDYPMVAPAYAKARSVLAKGMGLGASRRQPAAEELATEEPVNDLPDSAPEEGHEVGPTEDKPTSAKPPRGRRAKAATTD